MTKIFTINSLKEFKRWTGELPYLELLPEDRITVNLKLKKPVIIEEAESEIGETVLTIKRPEEINNIIVELGLIRKKLNKYLRSALIDNMNRIEQLRIRAYEIKSMLGSDWYKDEVYMIDRYKGLRMWLFSQQGEIKGWLSKNKDLIVDFVADDRITFGYRLVDALKKITLGDDVDISSYDFNQLLYVLLNELPYKTIEFDFSYLNRVNLVLAESDIALSNKEYIIKNLTCSSLGKNMNGGKISIYDSNIEALFHHARGIDATIKNCKVFEEPFLGAENIKKRIINLKYFEDNHRKNKKMKRGGRVLAIGTTLLGVIPIDEQ